MIKRDFTEEQAMFRQAYRRFLAEEIVPNMEAWREKGIVDRGAFKKAGDHGFLMVWPDEAYGGIGDDDFRFEQIIIEENAYARTQDWFCTLHSRLVGQYIQRFGNDEQRSRILPKCVTGDCILAIAMTEPAAGSDLAGMRTVAEEHDEHWVLNGSKTYISNGINADLIVVAAKTGGPREKRHMTLFLVERGMAGFERGTNLRKMGMKAQDTAELFFNDVAIPKSNVLGRSGEGFGYLMESLVEERLLSAVQFLSAAHLSFDLTLEFVKERRAFGAPISTFQNTQFKLAELKTRLDVAQVYVDQCVAAMNAGSLRNEDAAKAKLLTSELQNEAAEIGVQFHGGAGYMDEYPISRQYTDARISTIYAGSSEIMKLIISRQLFDSTYQPFGEINF